MAKPRAEVSLRLSFGGQAPTLDERTVRLLELIDLHGSITQAARALGISYRTAWILVDELKACGEGSVVSAFRGGTINGSRLAPAGQALVEQFRRAERELANFLDQLNDGLRLER
jgi:molybdate transport system regulatory protein